MKCYHDTKSKKQFGHIITLMPKKFDSHQFILKLAELNQAEYIRSLHAYVNTDAPFRTLHAHISKTLKQDPNLTHAGFHNSPNIFGITGENALWEK